MRSHCAALLTAVTGLSLSTAANAAGNAQIVDDAAIETPGVCHFQMWGTRFGPSSGLLDFTPGCTWSPLPNAEIGASLQHAWDHGTYDTAFGPDLKYMIVDPAAGVGVAVESSVYFGTRTGQVETADVIVPITFAPSERLIVNLNVGWLYTPPVVRHDFFYGAQVMFKATQTITLMAERFGTSRGKPGDQFGVRWTSGAGNVDVDLLFGQRIDGAVPRAFTLGLTIRR